MKLYIEIRKSYVFPYIIFTYIERFRQRTQKTFLGGTLRKIVGIYQWRNFQNRITKSWNYLLQTILQILSLYKIVLEGLDNPGIIKLDNTLLFNINNVTLNLMQYPNNNYLLSLSLKICDNKHDFFFQISAIDQTQGYIVQNISLIE